MIRPLLKWVVYPSFVSAVSVLSLQAFAQKDIVPFDSISPVQGLRTGPIIPLPTIQMRGKEIVPKSMASPFSGSVPSGATYAPGGLRYPGDLSFHGGQTLDYTANHSFFVNPSTSCPPNACWGDPIGFLHDLGYSQLIHVADQYVGDHAPGRYKGGTNYLTTGYEPSSGPGKPFIDLDMAIAAYSLALHTGGFGSGHIYHLFLTPGQDICFDNTFSVCYSPDNLKTWAFCAYHGSASDTQGNVVLYSVEPYQNVPGCDVGPDTPNGQLADSTNNVLSHETFETITDPFGDAWWNSRDVGLFGQEIGDECTFVTPDGVYWSPSLVRLNHKQYVVQPEYSNAQHACSSNTD